MQMDTRRSTKGNVTKRDGRKAKVAKPDIYARNNLDLGTVVMTCDDLAAMEKGLKKAARLPNGRLEQRIG